MPIIKPCRFLDDETNTWSHTRPLATFKKINNEEFNSCQVNKVAAIKRVFINGCFDILTLAHVKLLEFAAQFGPLTVGLNSDSSIRHNKGPNRPINNQDARKKVLESIKFVDKVIIFDEFTAEEVLEHEKAKIWVKGGDYNLDTIPIGEKMACLRNGTEIVFFDYIEGYSTTKTLEKLWNVTYPINPEDEFSRYSSHIICGGPLFAKTTN